jgi:hypothetical protein
MISSDKKASRFRYNQGVYQLKMKVGDEWREASPEIGGSYSKCHDILETHRAENPSITYDLFYLTSNSDGEICWDVATESDFYFRENQIRFLRYFKDLGLSRDDRGVTIMSNITNISKSSIVKMLKSPTETRFQSISAQGMLYISYRIKKHLNKGN